MDTKSKKQNSFSSFFHWISALVNDEPSIKEVNGGQDFFSKLMNRISG
ncbi:ferredoxin--nitrite reductase [Prochlorococcus sp. MIT 1223]|nr:ferredoxin--nitrite reductase [Prochlorococcus sp. MIT 1223]